MSLTEILLILVIVLVFLGPEKIPEVARMIGKGLREVRKASNLLRDAVMIDEEDRPSYAGRTVDNTPSADNLDIEEDWVRDPDPKRDVRLEEMNPRKEPGGEVEELTLAAAKTDLRHREVYLHIPYEETI